MNTPSKLESSNPTASSIPMDRSSFHARQIVAGRYEILSLLGEGGSGEVWRVYDLKLRVEVALKALRILANQHEDSLEFFRREVRTAREVISPNVCRIFDLVVEEDRELISMEYIDGITLMAMLIKKGPMTLQKAGGISLRSS